MWINNIEYYNTNQWVGIFNKDYKKLGVKINAEQVHKLFKEFGINGKSDPNKPRVTVYPKKQVDQLRTMDKCDKFIDALKKITTPPNTPTKPTTLQQNQDEVNVDYDFTYKNNENDMEGHSNYLINKYQFESVKRITISESAYKRLFKNR